MKKVWIAALLAPLALDVCAQVDQLADKVEKTGVRALASLVLDYLAGK